MSKRILETLFESRARVRLLRFLFRNYPQSFTIKEMVVRLQEDRPTVKKEIARFMQIGLLIESRK